MDATSPSTFPLALAEAPAAGHTRHPPSRFKRQLTSVVLRPEGGEGFLMGRSPPH